MIAESRAKPLAQDDIGRPIWAYNDAGKPVCGAQRYDGSFCKSTARYPNGRCKRHGGKSSLRKVNSLAPFRAEFYTSKLPERYRFMFKRMLENPDMLNLKVDIALQDLRMQTLIEELDHGFSSEVWEEFKDTFDNLLSQTNFEKAEDSPEYAVYALQNIKEKLENMRTMVELAAGEKETWGTIAEVSKVREKLVTSEANRLSKERGVMPAEQVYQIFCYVMESVRRRVSNVAERLAIAQDIDKMSILPGGQQALGGKGGAEGMLLPNAAVADVLEDEIIEVPE